MAAIETISAIGRATGLSIVQPVALFMREKAPTLVQESLSKPKRFPYSYRRVSARATDPIYARKI